MTRRISGDLARFAYEKDKVGKKLSKCKSLFRPNKNGVMSVSRLEDLDCREILELGLDFAQRQTNCPPIFGWFEFKEDAVSEAKLKIDYDDNPPRHANIYSWPKETSDKLLAKNELFKRCFRKAAFPEAVTNISQLTDPCSYVQPFEV